MNIEQELKIMQRNNHNEVMDEIIERRLNIIQYNEFIQSEKHAELHAELMPMIIQYHRMLKRRKPNNWIKFIQYYSSITGNSMKMCMQDPECKRLYRL